MWKDGDNGIALQDDGLHFVRSGTSVDTVSSGNSIGWHNATITIDRVSSEYKCYYNAVNTFSDSNLPSSNTNNPIIGQTLSGSESEYALGQVNTYDRVLDTNEISVNYLNFILDAKNPYPFTKMVGVVRDSNEDTLEGANVILYDHTEKTVVDETISESNGVYTVRFPSPGEYSLYTTKSGTVGGRAFTLTVTSGEDIIVYD
jgi:hypothetical protein